MEIGYCRGGSFGCTQVLQHLLPSLRLLDLRFFLCLELSACRSLKVHAVYDPCAITPLIFELVGLQYQKVELSCG